ncbi:asparagine synthase-related protein [Vibrio bathopelagicus]|uniref:asparagine synthase-related protein n=1 Tax=Vibrio bathopelagicus TaxID=2777577 RepID=UPI001864C0DE|nr:asparagine synthase-related protein [Vibrio bathopelagicus]
MAELARRGLQEYVTTFTFSLPKKFELNIALEVATKLGFKHVHLPIENDDILDFDNYTKTAEAHDYQIWNTPYVPPELHKEMGKYGDILLSGFGGDPIMGSHLASSEKPLNEYLFEKYRWLHLKEIKNQPITDIEKLKDSIDRESLRYDSGSILTDFDAWYLCERNTNMTQHSVLGYRGQYEIISPLWIRELLMLFQICHQNIELIEHYLES